jgi:hypothetical protein
MHSCVRPRGVILRDLVLKDLARTATIARVHIRCALDPSRAQDDPTTKLGIHIEAIAEARRSLIF